MSDESAKRPVLVFAGVDPSGAAGLTRDLWALAQAGVRTIAIPSCLTVQGETPRADAVDEDWLDAAWRSAIAQDIGAVKVGLVVHEKAWRHAIPHLQMLRNRDVPIVVDPVRGPTRGGFEAEDGVRDALLDPVAQISTVLTPNVPEMTWLAGEPEDDAVQRLLDAGYDAVFLKGGHRPGDTMTDRFATRDEDVRWRRPRIAGPSRRGTGCVLSSYLAAALAEGLDAKSACRVAAHRLGQTWHQLDAGD